MERNLPDLRDFLSEEELAIGTAGVTAPAGVVPNPPRPPQQESPLDVLLTWLFVASLIITGVVWWFI